MRPWQSFHVEHPTTKSRIPAGSDQPAVGQNVPFPASGKRQDSENRSAISVAPQFDHESESNLPFVRPDSLLKLFPTEWDSLNQAIRETQPS